MLSISSSDSSLGDLLAELDVSMVTLDIETLDSRDLNRWNEPIISFSMSIIPKSDGIPFDLPTLVYILEDIEEEKALLQLLSSTLSDLREYTFTGHNISLELEFKKSLGWSRTGGYDFPKILSRERYHGLPLTPLEDLKIFDTIEIAYFAYTHDEHNRLTPSGDKKRVLGSVVIEEDFNITRPKDLPKLGPRVRDYFLRYANNGDATALNTIIQYNACDTLVESIISSIFHHQLYCCKNKNGLISFKNKCSHIPSMIEIEALSIWQKLISSEVEQVDDASFSY